MLHIALFVGRALFSLIFIGSGIAHLTKTTDMAGYASHKGVPSATLATRVSGVMILLGGAFMLTGYWVDLGALLTSIFCIATALFMHSFWTETDPMNKMNEQTSFLKNMALGGASLAIFALYHIGAHDQSNILYGHLFFD